MQFVVLRENTSPAAKPISDVALVQVYAKVPFVPWDTATTTLCLSLLGDRAPDVYGTAFPDAKNCTTLDHRQAPPLTPLNMHHPCCRGTRPKKEGLEPSTRTVKTHAPYQLSFPGCSWGGFMTTFLILLALHMQNTWSGAHGMIDQRRIWCFGRSCVDACVSHSLPCDIFSSGQRLS